MSYASSLSRWAGFAASPWRNFNRSRASIALVAIALSACDVTDRAIAPNSDFSARDNHDANQVANQDTKKSLTQAFMEAQGTYCDAATPGDCELAELYDNGYYSSWCNVDCEFLMGADFGGVNARWWARNGLSPEFPAYYFTGTVSETRLPDGRRRIIANVRGHNTFVFVSAGLTLEGMLLGADFFEYPIISPLALIPILGEASLAAELIVPSDFEGMPDVTQLLFFPSDGMEIRRLNLTVTTRGPLRQDNGGYSAGTIMEARGTFRYLPKLAKVDVKSRRLIQLGYDATSRITLKPASGQ